MKNGVTIVGETNLPATMPFHASQMYSRNVDELPRASSSRTASSSLDFDDEIVRDTCVTHEGRVLKEPA